MDTRFLFALFLVLANPAWATEDTQRLDNRTLRANFRVFMDSSEQYSRNQVTITEYGEQTTRFLGSCPEQVQIGGVQIDENSQHSFTGIESATYISDANISVFCE